MDIMDIAVAKALSGGGGGGGGGSAEPFFVNFTLDGEGNVTADKTFAEVCTALEGNSCVLGKLHFINGSTYISSIINLDYNDNEITGVSFEFVYCNIMDNAIDSIDAFECYIWSEGIDYTEGSRSFS